jgi:hypothetical protein
MVWYGMDEVTDGVVTDEVTDEVRRDKEVTRIMR